MQLTFSSKLRLRESPGIAQATPEAGNKKAAAGKHSGRGSIKNGGQASVVKVVRRVPHPGIDAKIESRDGVRTIVFSRSWLNAFFFGVRLAWLSPFPPGVIEVLDLTALFSGVRPDL